VPAPGSADDPALNVGMRILLFGHSFSGEIAELVVPPGLGRPGWSESSAGPARYRFRNGDAPAGPSPVRWVSLREGRRLSVVAKAAGLALSVPQGSVGVRIEIGSGRLCALFAGESVRRDEAGAFVARWAPAPGGLVQCTDEGLFGVGCEASPLCGGLCPDGSQCSGVPGLGSCTCVSPTQPCGDTATVCNGQCPAGEVCANIGGVPYPACGCLPAGSVGCGTVETCGDGDCPTGLGCYVHTFTCCGGLVLWGCGCSSEPQPPPCGGPCPPGLACLGPVPGFPQDCYPLPCSASSCPSGSTCEDLGGGSLFCFPIACSGGSGYPACDGTCDPSLSCQGFVQGSGACYCAP
jgi:hypothetical protein